MSRTKEPVFQLVTEFRELNKMDAGEMLESFERETETVWKGDQ